MDIWWLFIWFAIRELVNMLFACRIFHFQFTKLRQNWISINCSSEHKYTSWFGSEKKSQPLRMFACSDRCLSAVYWLFDATVTAYDVMVSVLFFHFSSTFCNRSISKNHLEMRRKIEKPSHVKSKDGKQFLIDFNRLLC